MTETPPQNHTAKPTIPVGSKGSTVPKNNHSGAALMGLTLVLVWTQVAFAHSVTDPKVLRVQVLPSELVIHIMYALQPGQEAQQHRLDADSDNDAQLDAYEQLTLTNRLRVESTFALTVTCDGQTITPSLTEVTKLHGATEPKVSGTDLHIEIKQSYAVRWSEALTHCVITDRHKFPRWPVWAIFEPPTPTLRVIVDSGEEKGTSPRHYRVDHKDGFNLRVKVHNPPR